MRPSNKLWPISDSLSGIFFNPSQMMCYVRTAQENLESVQQSQKNGKNFWVVMPQRFWHKRNYFVVEFLTTLYSS